MSHAKQDHDAFLSFAMAAADLLVCMDAHGRIIHATGDAALLHHPTVDRLAGKNALQLISEGEVRRLQDDLWTLAPGKRLAWEDAAAVQDGRRIIVQRRTDPPDEFSLLVSRMPRTTSLRVDSSQDILAERFRDAVMNGRLKAARQPVVDTRTGVISHYEILARFDGAESPIELITAAERSGQISHLDYIMVSAAVMRLCAEPDPTYRLAVNISGESLQNFDVVRELCAVISGHTFRRSRLIIEVTESSRIDDIETAARSVAHLRAHGVSVSLDDFGAGAASLGYLRDLDVDGLKFDGAFLRAPRNNARSIALLRNVASLCAELGIASVGERVETEDDRRVLLEAGIPYAQGYFFGRPAIDETFFMRARSSLAPAA